MPTNPKAAPLSNVGLFLNPLASWMSVTSNESLNQVVSLETYNRLVRQELNQPFSSASSSTGSSNVASNTNFDQYYHNFSDIELKEINVILFFSWTWFIYNNKYISFLIKRL